MWPEESVCQLYEWDRTEKVVCDFGWAFVSETFCALILALAEEGIRVSASSTGSRSLLARDESESVDPLRRPSQPALYFARTRLPDIWAPVPRSMIIARTRSLYTPRGAHRHRPKPLLAEFIPLCATASGPKPGVSSLKPGAGPAGAGHRDGHAAKFAS